MAIGIITIVLAKLGRDENVNTKIFVKICKTLKSDISDKMGIVHGNK